MGKQEEKSLIELLSEVQAELKAPKGKENKFGKYKYRSSEDILEAVKPLLSSRKMTINLTDRLEVVGERYYIVSRATVKATLQNGMVAEEFAEGWAREAVSQAGMSDGQVTGATSSYSRKYALNGLLAIDDTKDLDTDEHQGNKEPEKKPTPPPTKPASKLPALVRGSKDYDNVVKALTSGKAVLSQVETKFTVSPTLKKELSTINKV